MSRSSIFDTGWTDIVFEGRNQEYGAYLLRKQSPQTTLKALLIAVLLISSLTLIPVILSQLRGTTVPPPDILNGPTVILDRLVPPDPQPPIKKDVVIPPVRSEEPAAKTTYKDAEVVKPVEADETASVTAPVSVNDHGAAGSPEGTSSEPGRSTGSAGPVTGEAPETPNGPVAMEILDKRPSYPGGNENFKNEIAKRFNTPEDEFESGTIVSVELTFIIEKDGSLTNIQVVRSSGKSLDQEALRVLRSMKKKWEPGYYKGKPVSVIFKQAIKLRVQ